MFKQAKQMFSNARNSFKSGYAKIAGAGTAMVVSSAALAGGGSTPGAAIAGELAGGGADMGLVFAAIAVLLGLLLLWSLTKRAAKA